jgi:hypothetical protein
MHRSVVYGLDAEGRAWRYYDTLDSRCQWVQLPPLPVLP